METQASINLTGAIDTIAPELWSGLFGSSAAMEFLKWAGHSPQTTLLVCPNDEEAAKFYQDCLFFQKKLPLAKRILFYPTRESDFQPGQYLLENIIDQRLSALYYTADKKPSIIITSLKSLAQKTIPKEIFRKTIHAIMLHDELPRDQLLADFIAAGYEKETTCQTPGTFSVRGDIIDFFSPNHTYPVRMEFFGDQVERLIYFDPETQSSIPDSSFEYAEWIAAKEILLPSIDQKTVLRRIKNLADDLNLPPHERAPIEDAIRENIFLPAMDHLFPIFYDQSETLIDHLPANTQWALYDPLSLKTEIQGVEFEFEKSQKTETKLHSPLKDFLIDLHALDELIRKKTKLYISEVDFKPFDSIIQKNFSGIELHQDLQSILIQNKKMERPFQPLADRIRQWIEKNHDTYVVVSSDVGIERLKKILAPYFSDISIVISETIQRDETKNLHISITIGDLAQGFSSDTHQLTLLTEAEIFGEQKLKQMESITQENMLESLSQLQIEDPVVHIDHGVGIYKGLQRMKINNIDHDFLIIQYLDKDKLFLPVYRLNRIHKYISGDGKKPKIERLGSQNWEQAKKKAQKAIEEMAQELIELYAKRKIAKGYSYSEPDDEYVNFESEFAFEETRDQMKSIEEIFNDLESEKPMDRLVCGDVGFGKTEVALRAAYRVASEGRQVAVLVPTTILCQQHYQTFKKRFKNFAIEVDFLSRFKSTSDAKETIEKLKTGHVDIIIGTHRLLSKDVEFANLGLLILDEEHRFGVKHKEHIKKFRNKIDVLTLTATPIPRTLQLSMTGIRDLSVINTPPLERKAVHTILCNFEDQTIRNSVMKEMSRKGQVFFLHNRVESIYTMKSYLSNILPEVRIQVAHGQMNQQDLEKTMLGFLNHDFDMLLCTTIIESGLDIPNANTLLVNRADTFGLSQLYQIRGRVGRSHRESYAYFMVPDRDRMSRDAVKRLKVLKQFTDLGSGLKISLHDMEIRGAGNLLGSKQSGQISSVGFELYSQLLEREIRKLKGENVKEEIEPEIQVNIAAFIPDDYIHEQTERLRFYKRLSACKDLDEMSLIKNEFLDRFGPLPSVVENLFDVVDLKMVARESGVTSIKISGFSPVIEFSDSAPINVDRLLAMAKKDGKVRLTPDHKLILNFDSNIEPMSETKKILRELIVGQKPQLERNK